MKSGSKEEIRYIVEWNETGKRWARSVIRYFALKPARKHARAVKYKTRIVKLTTTIAEEILK